MQYRRRRDAFPDCLHTFLKGKQNMHFIAYYHELNCTYKLTRWSRIETRHDEMKWVGGGPKRHEEEVGVGYIIGHVCAAVL